MCCSSERKILENITADKCIETSLSLAGCTDHCSNNNICFRTFDNSKGKTCAQDDNNMMVQLQLLYNFILTGKTTVFYSNTVKNKRLSTVKTDICKRICGTL